ncbi:MAG: TIGR02757 family protein [Desulfatibacillaceae bacterium]|nr:TIGR02757 family protein [Desulfatibacillaceae bacterium]
MKPALAEDELEHWYARYNNRSFVGADPVGFVHAFDDPDDCQVAGLIASCLAYGRVAQISSIVSRVLGVMGPSPAAFIRNTPQKDFPPLVCNMGHRFCKGNDIASLLAAIKRLSLEYGSLEEAFCLGLSPGHETVLPALAGFAQKLIAAGFDSPNHLVPAVARGSACKRLNLYLRWMTRSDNIDVGIWKSVSPAKLIIPLDIHMHRQCLAFGLTKRKAADMKTALEVTAAFRRFAPKDPVRYDFAITRRSMEQQSGKPHAAS